MNKRNRNQTESNDNKKVIVTATAIERGKKATGFRPFGWLRDLMVRKSPPSAVGRTPPIPADPFPSLHPPPSPFPAVTLPLI